MHAYTNPVQLLRMCVCFRRVAILHELILAPLELTRKAGVEQRISSLAGDGLHGARLDGNPSRPRAIPVWTHAERKSHGSEWRQPKSDRHKRRSQFRMGKPKDARQGQLQIFHRPRF